MIGKTLEDYKGYQGIDVSLSISLFEYGLIWAKEIEGHEKDFHFIYGVDTDKTGSYNKFSWGDVPIDCDPRKEWDWVDWSRILSFIGYEGEEERYFNLPDMLPQIVRDLISYYGHVNVFGESTYCFTITE